MASNLNRARALYEHGSLVEAEALCRGTAHGDADRVGTLCLLAAICAGTYRYEEAIVVLREAAAHDPHRADVQNELGVHLNHLGRYDEAAEHLDRAVGLDPGLPEAHYNLANALKARGRREDAVAGYRRALELRPDLLAAHTNLGVALTALDRPDEAIACYRSALALDPRSAETHFNLGNALSSQECFEEAVSSYRQAAQISPELFQGHHNLGITLTRLGRVDEALSALGRALEIRPDSALAHNSLGSALRVGRRLAEAITSFERALKIDPAGVDGYHNLGVAHEELGNFEEASSWYRRAVQRKPEFAGAHNGLESALMRMGRYADAIDCFERALALDPGYSQTHSNLLFCADLDPSYDVPRQQAERRRWWLRHGAPLIGSIGSIPPHANRPDPDRRLRVGYVSADFMRHSAASVFGPLVKGHDPNRFEVAAYSGVAVEDDVTESLRDAVDGWCRTAGMSDEVLAQRVRADAIDILVDLSGHSNGNRLLVFARKPAPIQISGWGYATGTGLPTMDYLVSDRVRVPPDDAAHFTEEVEWLSSSLTFEPPAVAPTVGGLPALARGTVTFGALNRLSKNSPLTYTLWSRILAALPGSRLLMKAQGLGEAAGRESVAHQFEALGIERERLVLRGNTSRQDHLAAYNEIDLGLDPVPQGGGVTTAEALWMGVPVLTLAGRTSTARVGASLMTLVGLDELVADSEDSYVDIAVSAGGRLEWLANVRRDLRARVRSSPLGDRESYVAEVERFYRRVWRRWCEGLQ